MVNKTATLTSVALLGWIVACGSGDASEFGSGGPGGNGSNGTDPYSLVDENGNPVGGGGSSGTDPKCASSIQDAKLTPLNLVFMYDKSGSMGDYSQSYSCSGSKDVDCQTVSLQGTPFYLCATRSGNNFDVSCSKQGNNISCKNSNTNADCGTQTMSNGKTAIVCQSVSSCTLAADYDPAKKWVPVGNAMKSFFTDANSAGMSATLGFFPKLSGNTTVCDSTQYTSSVALTALGPSATAFGSAIDAQTTAGGTPSKPALEGAIAEAQAVRSSRPGEAVAVVLVTDGMPTSCDPTPNNDSDNVSNVAAVAQSGVNLSSPVYTYVIGVQDATAGNLALLDQVAAAGSKDGKGKAFIVQVGNPAQTSADLQKALEAIRGSAISCDTPLPAPPAGKSLDINAVNVVANIGGKEETLSYSKDCANGTGWHYDNAAAPKIVQLCPTTCSAIRADSGGKLSIAFGCATKGGVIL